MSKGKLITLYGINNIGKSTQAKILIENLQKAGYEAECLKYPIYDLEPSGPFINQVLRGSEKQEISEEQFQMWYTLNRYQYQNVLIEKLESGKIIIAEDYIGTGLAWGSAKGANLDWLIEINKYLLPEDLAIYLKGKRQMHAKEHKHLHEQDDNLIEAASFIFDNLAEKFNWRKVTVTPSISGTADDIWAHVKQIL